MSIDQLAIFISRATIVENVRRVVKRFSEFVECHCPLLCDTGWNDIWIMNICHGIYYIDMTVDMLFINTTYLLFN